MFVLVRAVTYSTLFIGFLLVFLPARILSRAGISRPDRIGISQVAGMLIVLFGALLAAWCILTFVFIGRGTPAPFDPPRRLVANGPYGFVRNPMYVGALFTLAGAALFYQSWSLLLYCAFFGLTLHILVLAYEEPTLRETFGAEYDAYCHQVPRWVPRF
jgi:protein-S-isoprenylcysteine O-methyltransferase Ste14